MKTTDFNKLKFRTYRYFQFDSKEQREIKGWDTETSRGQCGLLCNSDGQVIESHDIDTLLMHLTEENYQKTVNMFYNLTYDYSAILKCLPAKNIEEIAVNNFTQYHDYKLQLIPKKLFKIQKDVTSDSGKIRPKTWKYFDMWQFFKYEKSGSLDAVSEKYLGEHKVDVEGITGISKAEYKFKDFKNEEIQKYCIDDSLKVAKLGKIISESCNHIGLMFNQPYSCATLSMNYVYGLKGVKSPLWFFFNRPKNRKVFEYAFNTYSGGRFEVTQRGTFQDVWEYDVNSMYPKRTCELQDIFKTDFEFCKSEQAVDKLRNKETYYVFLKIKVKPDMKFINILPIREEGLIIYPRTTKHITAWVTLPELELLEKYNQDFQILEGFVGTPEVVEYPYQAIFEEIYSERMKYPKSHFLSSLYKIIMNSFYGKKIEMNLNLTIDDSKEDAKACHDVLDMLLDEENEDIVLREYIPGKFFCPPYASMITSTARCVVADAMLSAPEPEQNIVGCFTDSVISLCELDLPVSSTMGDWEMHQYDEMNMVGTGVYYLHSNSGEQKTRTRGFKFMNMADFDFATFLQSKYPTKKNISLKEAVRTHDLDNFNVIMSCQKEKTDKKPDCTKCQYSTCPCKKEVNINFDMKRKWDREFKSVSDIFKSRIGSKTRVI